MRNLSAFQPNGLKQIQLADTPLFSDANLVSYWKLEDLNDSKGSNTLTNNGSATFTTGKFNNGVTLVPASSQYLSVADNASLSITGNLSLSAWIKFTSTSGTQQIITKRTSTGNQRSFNLFFNANTLGMDVFVDGSTGGQKTVSWTPTTGVWYHVVASYTASAGSVSFYVDGAQQGATQTGMQTSIYDSTSPLAIGCLFSPAQEFFNGMIDDVAIFSKALTAAEVSQLYYAGSTKAYYPLNGNSTDYSGNGNHGTPTAITYPQGRFGQGAKFNGSTSKIAIGTTSFPSGASARTGSVWVNPTALPTTEYALFNYGASTTNNAWGLLMGNYSSTQKIRIMFYSNDIDYAYSTKLNQWTNFVTTFDGTTARLFINGVLVNAINPSAGVNTSLGGGHLGIFINGSSSPFSGLLDEVIIENRAWSAKEVETYYRKSVLNYRKKGFSSLIDLISKFFFFFR